MKLILSAPFLMVLISVCSFAQTDNPCCQNGQPYIEVSGSAESEIDPNEITVSIRLKEYEDNKSKVSLETLDKDFMSAVNKANIPKSRINIATLSVNAITQKKKNRESFAEKTYLIQFTESKQLLDFLQYLEGVQIDRLGMVKLSHTEMERYRLELKIQALKAAEKKAEQLLQAVGSRKGKPLQIIENDYEVLPVLNDSYLSNSSFKLSEESSVDEASITFQKIKLRYEIRARFEIE